MNTMKIRRMQAGVTQFDLAKAANVSEAKICRVETGRCIAPHYLRQKIAAALGLDVAEIFCTDGAIVAEQRINHPINRLNRAG